MKISLKDIIISGFQNLAENQKVEFTSPGLYGVTGVNLDDGGSSNASGKSSFTRAITTGILGSGYVDITNKGLKNRLLGINPILVPTLEVNDKVLHIDRTIGGKLTATLDGIPLVGKTDEIQAKIIDMLGISPEHFIHLTHKMQGHFGGFLLMKDSEKKDFLGSFFDTKKLDKVAESADIELKALQVKSIANAEQLKIAVYNLNSLRGEVQTLTEKVQRYTSTEYISKIAAKKSELTVKEVERNNMSQNTVEQLLMHDPTYQKLSTELPVLTESFNTTAIANADLTAKLNTELQQHLLAVKEPIMIPTEMTARLAAINAELVSFSQNQTKLHTLMAQTQNKNLEYTKIESKLVGLVPEKCSVCGQGVSMEIFEKIKSSVQDELRQCSDALLTLNDQVATVSSTIGNPEDINDRKNIVLREIAAYEASNNKDHLKQVITTLSKQIQAVVAEQDSLLKNLNNTRNTLTHLQNTAKQNYNLQISKLNAELNTLKIEIQGLETEAKSAQSLLDSVNNKYQLQLDQLTQLEASVSSTAQEISTYTKIQEILSRNGFLGYIFDSILEEINSEVNENIKQIPVISRLSMYFTPDKTVKTTGAVNKSITSNIFDNGEEISFETLSGSEKESLLTAVDVAVDTILCNRLGVDINYKIFDEQFGWVDGDNKEHLLEFIKNKYRDKIVLIIDHGSELNAAIDKKIIVTKQNGIATVSCQSAS